MKFTINFYMNEITIQLIKKQIIEVDGKSYKVEIEPIEKNKCKCGCGKAIGKNKKYYNGACRSRAYRLRKEFIKKDDSKTT